MIADGEILVTRSDGGGVRAGDERVIRSLAVAQVYGADLNIITEVEDHKGSLTITWKTIVFVFDPILMTTSLSRQWNKTAKAIEKAWKEENEHEIYHTFRFAL